MKIVLDTNVYSDFAEGLPEVVDILATSGEHLLMPSIVLGELSYGFMKGSRRDLNENKLLQIMDTMPDGICIINQDFDLEYANPAMEKQRGPAKGRKCHAYFGDQDEPCQWCAVSEILTGQTVRREWFFEKAQKTYDLVGTRMEGLDGASLILEVFHDITERRAAEQGSFDCWDSCRRLRSSWKRARGSSLRYLISREI